jgi:hypothetical protein
MNGHIVYEVTSRVRADVTDAWRAWIVHHAAEVVRLGGFVGAVVAEAEPHVFVASYRAPSQAALDAYLADHGPALRQDALDRFGDAVVATRRTLTVFVEV